LCEKAAGLTDRTFRGILAPAMAALAPAQVIVLAGYPILADWNENLEIERVLQRHDSVWNVRRNVQDFALADSHLLPGDDEKQTATLQQI